MSRSNIQILTTEAIAYIRGRSIQKTCVIIDEAQNLTPKQVKGIITRAGRGTKIILLGDPDQIDHPYLDRRTNGLSYAAERMKGSKFCAQISMNDDECERSPLTFDSAVRMNARFREQDNRSVANLVNKDLQPMKKPQVLTAVMAD